MTAVTDIQQALNVIRRIEREAPVDTKMAALAMMTATAADIARELRGTDQPLKKRAPAKAASSPKSMPATKPAAAAKSSADPGPRLHSAKQDRLQSQNFPAQLLKRCDCDIELSTHLILERVLSCLH